MNWKLNQGMTETARIYFEGLEQINLTDQEFDKAIYKFRHKLGVDPSKEMSVKEHKIWRSALSGRTWAKRIDKMEDSMRWVSDLDRPAVLHRFWNDLDTQQKKKWLLQVWLNNDSAMLQGFKWWKRKFRETGFITNCNKSRQKGKIKLYRGSHLGLENGLSWTDDIEVARTYAAQKEHNVQTKGVYEITVLPIQILAILRVGAVVMDKENNYMSKGTWDVKTYNKSFHNFEYVIDTSLSPIKLIETYDFTYLDN